MRLRQSVSFFCRVDLPTDCLVVAAQETPNLNSNPSARGTDECIMHQNWFEHVPPWRSHAPSVSRLTAYRSALYPEKGQFGIGVLERSSSTRSPVPLQLNR
jgi:hypothetical protein